MMFAQHIPIRTGLEAALDGVSPKVKQALELSHQRLAELGIPHVLVGGLAVGVHGYQYATQDIDWLVSHAAAFDGTGAQLIAFKAGVPILVSGVGSGVGIEYLTPEGPPSVVEAMAAALATSEATLGRVVVASAELIVWMKLKAGRSKDLTAVVELLRAGQIDGDAVREFLVAAGDEKVLRRFDAALQHAIDEG